MTYTTLRRLGEGDFGEVFLERDNLLGRNLAKKVMAATTGSEGQIDEAALMAATEHPNVVKVFGAGFEDGRPFVRMEFLERGSVDDVYGGEPVGVREALDIAMQAARGLHHLHLKGVVHRDVKSGNILLPKSGEAKIGDFGLAALQSSLDPMPRFYLPHLDPVDARSGRHLGSPQGDVYGLAVTLYRLLNGDSMFWRAVKMEANLERAIAAGKIPNRKNWQPHIHLSLRKAIVRGLNPKTSIRFATMADFRHALEKARPSVSWTMSRRPGTLLWSGRRGQHLAYEAELRANPENEKVHFELRKVGPSGKPRRSNDQSISDVTLDRALSHAAEVMGDIAISR